MEKDGMRRGKVEAVWEGGRKGEGRRKGRGGHKS